MEVVHCPRSFFIQASQPKRDSVLSQRIRVALAGVGNCCSSLVQGTQYYKLEDRKNVGITYPKIGPYTIKDIQFVAAFDIDQRKVGRDLSEAIFAEPNNVRKIAQPDKTGVRVQMSQPLDGISPVAGDKTQLSNSKPSNISRVLKEAKADLLVNLTPTGATRASEMYAAASLEAGCGFINGTPAKIASSQKWQAQYRKKTLPLVGDDVMDQIGSTILHKSVLTTLNGRGMHLDETYQLDIGGGTESQIALDKKRYEIKREIKTTAVAEAIPYKFPLVAGSSDFVDFMENRRTSYFWIRGAYFAGTEFTLDMRLSLEDGPACAGILADVIRMTKTTMDRKLGDRFPMISAYGFKVPPQKVPLDELQTNIEALVSPTKSK